MMQTLLVSIIGLTAFLYVLKIFIKQLSQSEKYLKCENCPIPDLYKSRK